MWPILAITCLYLGSYFLSYFFLPHSDSIHWHFTFLNPAAVPNTDTQTFKSVLNTILNKAVLAWTDALEWVSGHVFTQHRPLRELIANVIICPNKLIFSGTTAQWVTPTPLTWPKRYTSWDKGLREVVPDDVGKGKRQITIAIGISSTVPDAVWSFDKCIGSCIDRVRVDNGRSTCCATSESNLL